MFLDKFIHFEKNMGDQVKDRSPKKLKSLIKVPYVAHLKVQVPSFNVYLFISFLFSLDRVTHFRIYLGDQGMCRSPKNLKPLIEVPYVVDVKVHVLSFNMNLISSLQRIPRRGSYNRL